MASYDEITQHNVNADGSYRFSDVVNVIRGVFQAKSPVHPLLTRRHPQYEAMHEHWCFLVDSFIGGPQWLRKNLFRYFREGVEEFNDRVKRSWRENLCREIVEIWTANLFKEEITRDDNAPSAVKDFWEATDKEGRNIEEFMQDVSDWSSAVAPIYVVIDVPQRRAEHKGLTLSLADEESNGYSKPYAYFVLPQQMLDFSVDEDGRYTWAAVMEFGRDDADPLHSTGAQIKRIRLWTKQDWSLFEIVKNKSNQEDLVLIEGPVIHGLGRVPIVQAAHKKGIDPYRAIALVEDIAYKDRAIANFESQLGTIVADQTFSQLWIPRSGSDGQYGRNQDGYAARVIELGTKRIATFDASTSHKPFFASPDASQAQFILALIGDLRASAYRQAILDAEGGAVNAKGAKTATERSYEFKKQNGALAKKAFGLQEVEKEMAEIVCLWTKTPLTKEAKAAIVTYPDDFDVKALSDALNEAAQLQTITQFGAAFWSSYLARLVDKVLPDLPEDERTAIIDEINSNADFMQLASHAATEMLMNPPDASTDPNADPNATDNNPPADTKKNPAN